MFDLISDCENGLSIDNRLDGPVCHSGFETKRLYPSYMKVLVVAVHLMMRFLVVVVPLLGTL